MNSTSFRSQSMVIFDIDQTILDASQRYKDARRAGYIDKDGNAKRKRALETPNKARKRANEFLFSPENLRKDKVIPGALALSKDLAAQGHIIAYVTARHSDYRDVTRNQLEDKGFPIFKDDTDMELLFLKASRGEATPKYKGDTYAQLNSRYDVRMVFDDMKENLQQAVSQGITGVYESINDYTRYQVKSNPWVTHPDGASYFYPDEDNVKYGGTGGYDPDADPYDTAEAHTDPTGMGRVPLTNPPVKPRRKKMKNGKYRKEPAKKYVDRFMGDPKMNKEFPDRGQRYAVCLRYVEKFYGKSGLKSVGARPNPDHPVTPRDDPDPDYYVCRGCGYTADPVEYEEIQAEGIDPTGTSPTCPFCGERNSYQPRYYWQDKGYTRPPLSFKNPEEYSEDYMVPRDIHRLGKAADSLESTYNEQDVPEWWKSKLSVTAKDADTLADSLDYVAENPMPLMGLSVQVSGYRNAAGAFVMKGKKFLILERSKKETSKHGLWELPGGKVEEGETPREAAVIETKEEAGLDIKLKANLGPHHDNKKKKTYHAYIGVPKKGQKVKLSEEHSAHKWVTPEEVLAMPKKMVSHHLLYFLKKEGETIRSNPFFNKKTWTYTDNLGTNATVITGKVPTVFGEPEDATVVKEKNRFIIEYRGANRPTEASITLPDGSVESQKGVIHSVLIYPKEKPPVAEINQVNDNGYVDYLMAKSYEAETVEEREDYRQQAEIARQDEWTNILGGETPEEIMERLDRGPEFYLNNPRSNPPKKKIEKGKKLYKHMNGKEPEKIETKKIDIGDVWYQVGEGGCWQIGYMSGKETGQTEQKYTHTFNEETKDGNFPKLYATMPENGKPMLIITGGTWKIRTDDKGVAWIYD